MGQKRLSRLAFHRLAILSTVIGVVCAAIYIDSLNFNDFQQQQRNAVIQELSLLRSNLEGAINSNIQTVQGLVAVIEAEPTLNQRRFAQLAAPLFKTNNQLRNIGAAPDLILTYIYPMAGNEDAVGLDYRNNPQQWQAANRARLTSELVVAGPVNLVQGGSAFIGRLPVFTNDPTADNQRRFWGLVSAVIDVDDLYNASGLNDVNTNILLAIRGQDGTGATGDVFFGESTLFETDPVLMDVVLPTGTWQIAAIPRGGWPSIADNAWAVRSVLGIAAIGILLPIFIAFHLAKKSVQTRIQLEHSRRELQNFFDLSNNLLCIANLEGRYEKVNAEFTRLLGYTVDELMQQNVMDYIHPDDIEDTRIAALDLRAGKPVASYINRYRCKDGHYVSLLWNTAPHPATGRLYSTAIDITEKQENEKLLKRQQDLLVSMSELSRIGIWEYDRINSSVYWSEMTRKLLRVDDSYQPTIDDVMTFYDKEYHEKITNAINQAVSFGTPWNLELKMVDAEGRNFWAHVTGGAEMRNGKCIRLFGAFQDIHARKLQERQVNKAHIDLEQQMSLVKAIANAQSNFIAHNNIDSAFKELLNDILVLTKSSNGFIGEIFYHDNGTPFLRQHATTNILWDNGIREYREDKTSKGFAAYDLNTLFNTALTGLEPVIVNNATEVFPIEKSSVDRGRLNAFMAIPILKDNTGIGLIGIANREGGYDSDIIPRLQPLIATISQIIESIRNSRARERVEMALIAAKEEAESAARAKSDFLATMSHEIRTPMNGVLGMLNLLQRSNLDEAQRHKIEVAKNSCKSLLALINDILDFSKVDADKIDLENVDTDIRKLLGETVEALALRAQEKRLELIVDLSGITQNFVKTDPSRIRQVMTNLLGNAIKFTHQGYICVSARLEEVDDGWTLYVSVEDTGIGIAHHKLATLFDPFTQADSSTTREYGGTGLGLAICKRICQIMGGDIQVYSNLEKGSCFEFHIHLNRSHIEYQSTSELNLQDLSILIVDDNLKNGNVLAKQLSLWQVQTQVVTSASKALQQCAENTLKDRCCFDLVFIDMDMPNTNGIVLAEKLRQQPTTKELPLILMTPMASSGNTNYFANLGFSGYFPKPVSQEDILAALTVIKSKPTIIHRLAPYLSQRLNKNMKKYLKNSNNVWADAYRILLVEDNEVNVEVAEMMLQDLQLDCDVASNGEEAIEKLINAADDNPYALILMDCQMPIMDGYEASEKIRKGAGGERYRNIPIVALTANAMLGDQQKCFDAGMNGYLSKPIDEEKLIENLRQWLASKDQALGDNNAGASANNRNSDKLATTWDQSGALAMLKGRDDRLKALLSLFCDSTPERLKLLDTAVASQDCEQIKQAAHAIKGSAAQLKGYDLQKIASAMEMAAREKNAEEINQLYPQLTLHCNQLLQRFNNYLSP